MRNPFRSGIRAQLVLLVLLLILPFTIYVAHTYVRDAAADREQAGGQMLASARVTAARLDDHVGDIQQLLRVLAQVADMSPTDPASNDAMLRRLMAALPPHVNDISLWKPDGSNVGSVHPEVREHPIGMAQMSMFQRALTSADAVVEAPIRSMINGQWVSVFLQPVLAQGRVVGLISASTRLNRLQDLLLPSATLPAGTVLTVVDERGLVLARSIDPEKWIGFDTSQMGSYFRGGQGTEGLKTGPGVDGVQRMAGFTMSRRLPWRVIVAAPSSAVTSEAMHRTEKTLLSGLMIFGVATLGFVWIGNRIVRPLRQLADDASRIGSGRLDHRSTVASWGETGVLARTLNQMAAALEERSASLQRSEARLRQVTDNVPALVATLDDQERYVFANRAYQDWMNLDPREMIGKSLREVYGDEAYLEFADEIHKAMRGERVVYERELQTTVGLIHVHCTAVPELSKDGKVEGVYVLMHDITTRKINEERLRQLAEYDVLTGLSNRALFHDRLRQAMAQAARSGRAAALMVLDVDYFKQVNDRLGHLAGDDLLRIFARRLQETVRTSDTVGRLSGDEFAIVLLGVDSLDVAAAVAQKLVDAVRVPMEVRDQELKVTTSIGVALCLPGETDMADLIGRADAALYVAKGRGRNGYACEDRVISREHGSQVTQARG